jgi:hypothetical protein
MSFSGKAAGAPVGNKSARTKKPTASQPYLRVMTASFLVRRSAHPWDKMIWKFKNH